MGNSGASSGTEHIAVISFEHLVVAKSQLTVRVEQVLKRPG
jgi:hypothetical protein